MKDNILTITCECKDYLNLDELTEFQGNLKQRSDSDVEKIIKSIKKYGFSFPFFVWKHDNINHCLDGHGRMLAINKLREQGFQIPALPVVYVDCKDEQSAKDLLLRLNSHYGLMTKESVLEFIGGEFELNTEEISLPDTIIDFNDIAVDIDSFFEDGQTPQQEEETGMKNVVVNCYETQLPELEQLLKENEYTYKVK